MKRDDKMKLLSIAEEKGILCYQVIPSYESSEFIYKPILIYDGEKYLAKL